MMYPAHLLFVADVDIANKALAIRPCALVIDQEEDEMRMMTIEMIYLPARRNTTVS